MVYMKKCYTGVFTMEQSRKHFKSCQGTLYQPACHQQSHQQAGRQHRYPAFHPQLQRRAADSRRAGPF